MGDVQAGVQTCPNCGSEKWSGMEIEMSDEGSLCLKTTCAQCGNTVTALENLDPEVAMAMSGFIGGDVQEGDKFIAELPSDVVQKPEDDEET